VLILNQDGALRNGWQRALLDRDRYGIIGDGVMGHPAWPNGYVQGTFMFIRRDVLDRVGGFNKDLYPLWGGTCEYQLRACRQGFQALPVDVDPYFEHARGGKAFGSAIQRTLNEHPEQRRLFIKTPPEISVIITTYNFGRYLEQAVRSVLDQTFQATEIIIVDDGSTDNTAQVGRRLEDRWKGIRYIRQENQGASVAANTGIEPAKGRYVTVLDGDDWMAPTRLEKMHALALRHPHSVIYDDVRFVGNQGQERIRRMPDYDFEVLLNRNGMHKGILYPKKAWLQVGGYAPRMDNGREDWEFNIKLGLHGWCGVHLKEGLYMYRRQGQGRTEHTPRPRSYFKEKIIRMHRDIYEQGARPMACCGGKRRSSSTRTVSIQTTSGPAMSLDTQPEGDWLAMEYTGNSIGNQTIFGPSGQRYKYGRNQRNLRIWVRVEDREFMENTGLFLRFNLPGPAPEPESAPEPEEEAPAEPEVTTLPVEEAPVPEATRYAANLAEETGVDLRDVSYDGDKIGIADVRAYLDELGIDY
jgi:GT2 family glycosyltransferase